MYYRELNKTLSKQVELLTSKLMDHLEILPHGQFWHTLAILACLIILNRSSSYAGLNPRIEIFSSIHKSSLSKMGNARLRKSLMPAIVAMKHNPLMTNLYSRIKQRQAYKNWP